MSPKLEMQTVPEDKRWLCLPASYAIVTGVQLGHVLRYIGHDGSEIIRPNLPEPECRRGFHPQELISWAWYRGYSSTPFTANPQLIVIGEQANPYRIEFPGGNVNRMLSYLKGYNGVLEGQMVGSGRFHAVAWDCERQAILNPSSGKIITLDAFAINTFWILDRRNLDS